MVRLVGDKFILDAARVFLRNVWGTLMLALACGLLFVGWFGLLPFVGPVKLGALILSLFSRESKTVPVREQRQAV